LKQLLQNDFSTTLVALFGEYDGLLVAAAAAASSSIAPLTHQHHHYWLLLQIVVGTSLIATECSVAMFLVESFHYTTHLSRTATSP
jgi:hypothetical protein